MKKLLTLIILTLGLVGCFSTSPSNGSSAITKAKSMLTIGLNKSLGRADYSPLITLGGPSNQITSTVIDSTDKSNPFQIVTIEWDTLKKQNYAFTYYLFNTDSGTIRLDSMVFSDSLMYTTKYIKGMNVTHTIGFNGDGIIDVNYINDTQSVAGVLHKRFVGAAYDSSVVVSIFGHDSLGVVKKLIVKIHSSMNGFVSGIVDTNTHQLTMFNNTPNDIKQEYMIEINDTSLYSMDNAQTFLSGNLDTLPHYFTYKSNSVMTNDAIAYTHGTYTYNQYYTYQHITGNQPDSVIIINDSAKVFSAMTNVKILFNTGWVTDTYKYVGNPYPLQGLKPKDFLYFKVK